MTLDKPSSGEGFVRKTRGRKRGGGTVFWQVLADVLFLQHLWRRFSGIRSCSARFRKPTRNIMRYLAVYEDSLCDGWFPSGFFRQRSRFRRAIIRRFRACRRRFRRTISDMLAEGVLLTPGGKRVSPLGACACPPWGEARLPPGGEWWSPLGARVCPPRGQEGHTPRGSRRPYPVGSRRDAGGTRHRLPP